MNNVTCEKLLSANGALPPGFRLKKSFFTNCVDLRCDSGRLPVVARFNSNYKKWSDAWNIEMALPSIREVSKVMRAISALRKAIGS